MKTVYIGIGSNLNNPTYQVRQALRLLSTIPTVRLIKHSSLYCSKAIGPKNQPNYINAVAVLSIKLSPLKLLRKLQEIEIERGRNRTGKRWQARTLDLDILIYGEQYLQIPTLTIPHPELYNRIFVLQPLYECTPNLVLPNGQSLQKLISGFSDAKLWKI